MKVWKLGRVGLAWLGGCQGGREERGCLGGSLSGHTAFRRGADLRGRKGEADSHAYEVGAADRDVYPCCNGEAWRDLSGEEIKG